jgi:CRISPR type IV-associated protein Csf2
MRLGELLEEIPYSRRDDLDEREEKGAQMRYSVECLRPGVRLTHGLRLRTTDPILRGCLWCAVQRVSEQRMGGLGAKGHGRFSWTWHPDAAAIETYVAHVETCREGIRAILAEKA